jgi:tetratricopeptide (TPR) repeat protein
VRLEETVEEPASEPQLELEPEESAVELDPDADLDQLLAEASVFARYGKHERAVETLRAALRVEPGHALALEKLGEALAALGNRAHAASALTRAGAAHADAGDATGVERVRGLLAPLDAKAAAALAPVERAPEANTQAQADPGEIDIDLEEPSEDVEEASARNAAPRVDLGDDFAGIEVDVSSDFASEPSEPSEPPAASSSSATDDDPATLDDEAEFTFDSDDAPVAAEAPESAGTGPQISFDSDASEAPVADVSDVFAQVEADFAEAEFYREQGLHDEARSLYEKVLAASPEHAQARARLQEVAAQAPDGAPQAVGELAPEIAEPEAEADMSPNAAVVGATNAGEADAGDTTDSFEVEPAHERALPPPPRAPAATPVRAKANDEPPRLQPAVERTATGAAPPAPAPQQLAVATAPPRPTETPRTELRMADPPPALGGADFDLAAELSGALDEGGAQAATRADAEGFAEVFAAFKAGVKREVSEGDHEAHYDLGIAYKEMGLFEDAIGEFRVALADASRRLPCLHLMAACALELGRGADAVALLSDALAGGALPPEQEAALRLDLGRAHTAVGEPARARVEYEAVRALAPGFGDVDRLLEALAATPSSETREQAAEVFESFDDLLADESQPDPPAASAESFDDVLREEPDSSPALEEAPLPPEPHGPEAAMEEEIPLVEEAEPLSTPPPPAAAAPAPAQAKPRSPSVAAPPASAVAPVAEPAPQPAPRRKKKISFV